MSRRGLVARGAEIVTEARVERLFIPAGDAHRFDDRRPISFAFGIQQLDERGKLGLQLLALKLDACRSSAGFRFVGMSRFFAGLGGEKLGL